jgi:predicted DCC family thiol-disulfide oxidoreductase YuxK
MTGSMNTFAIPILNTLIYCWTCYFRKSQNILSELGFDESRFAAEKDQTIFLITPFGEILTHSDALLALLKVLPGSQHAALHALLAVIPNFLRNRVYGYVAENRHTLLGQASPTSQGANTASECTVLSSRPTAEQDRFL